MNDSNLQGYQMLLMKKLKSTLPQNISLADDLADLLEVSTDSAYRRIRGETALTIDEIVRICQHYKISFDALTAIQGGSVSFSFREVKTKEEFILYLEDISNEMERIVRAPERHITYSAVDVPIFHYFKFPEYLYFKMFYWLRSIANDPEFMTKKFAIEDLDPRITELCKKLWDQYARVPSTELWSDSILNSIVKQIRYYWLSGIFASQEDALKLISSVRSSLELVQREAEMNMKILSSGHTDSLTQNYQLFESDIEIGNNFILVSVGKLKILYNSFHTFNKMYTTSHDFCELTELWMNNLIKQANLISGVAEKQRFQFFRKMYGMLDNLSQTIMNDQV